MSVLNKKTGQWEDTPKEAAKKADKKAVKDKHKGKDYTKLTLPDQLEILVKMAKDMGYLE